MKLVWRMRFEGISGRIGKVFIAAERGWRELEIWPKGSLLLAKKRDQLEEGYN